MEHIEIRAHSVISGLIDAYPNQYVVMLKKKWPDIAKFLSDRYPALAGHPLSEHCYWFLNGLTDFPECANEKCQRKLSKFRNVKTGYLKYCSSKCSATAEKTHELYAATCQRRFGTAHPMSSGAIKEKVKQTCVERYGAPCSLQADAVKEKTRQTCIAKYGTDYALQAEEVKAASRRTNLEKYGVEYAAQAEEVKSRAKTTNRKRYGVDNPAKSAAVREKIEQTSLERYGARNACQSEQVKDQIRRTNIERYGTPCVFGSEEVRRKIAATNMERYGSENVFGSECIKKKIKDAVREKYGVDSAFNLQKARSRNVMSRRVNSYYGCVATEYDEPLFDCEYFARNYSRDAQFEFRCKKCGNVFKSRHYDGRHSRCPVCYPFAANSIPEKDIAEFMKRYVDVQENSRDIIKPLELDIYVPSKRLAVEFDGLYWHSDISGKLRNYHLDKTIKCEKAEIRLVHVFENEWAEKRPIVESRLKNMLGVYDKTVFARKCRIESVDTGAAKAFQEENHLQGAVSASIRLGLCFENQLVALMTFGKCRFDKRHEWEMLRFCCRLGWHIPGAAGRLLKAFERKYAPKSLVSYADRRWSTGKLYIALGFRLDHASPPDYWYWKNQEFSHRTKYQKHRLKNLLDQFDPSKSEAENMKANGYCRIYDCGNLVFVKEYPENV